MKRWLAKWSKLDCYSLDGDEVVRHRGWFRQDRLPLSQIDSWWVVHEMGFDLVVIQLTDDMQCTWIDKYNDLLELLKRNAWQRLRGATDPLQVLAISNECRRVLKDPVYSPELTAKLIDWLEVPCAPIQELAGNCLIELGSPAFQDMLMHVTTRGFMRCSRDVVSVLSSFPGHEDQMVPLVRSWLAESTGDRERQCALSFAFLLHRQLEAGVKPDHADVQACRRVIERNAASARITLRTLARLFEPGSA